MSMCRVTNLALIYHDDRDWIIEQRGEDYWCFPLDGDAWIQRLPLGLTAADMALMFPSPD